MANRPAGDAGIGATESALIGATPSLSPTDRQGAGDRVDPRGP